MSNRKLQKDIDIIFKKIQEGLHEFNYHYERYESINTEDDSDNQREKEKLENDLKKEIKKLQKFREQIKIWQSNDVIKTLSLSSASLSNKLNENKKLIEEAMEVYKDVERSSKLKTFSNQSIAMSSRENYNNDRDDDDDDDSEEEDLSDIDISEDDEEEYSGLSPDAIEAIHFLKDAISQLSRQSKKYNSEYEKLSQKKLRKNNLSTIESKKEKIQATLESHKFHTRKLLRLIKYLKGSKVPDINLIWLIEDDLNKYIEHSGDSDFVNDTGLYDDILNSVSVDDDFSELNDSEIYTTKESDENGTSSVSGSKNGVSSSNILGKLSSVANDSKPVVSVSTSFPTSPSPVNKNNHNSNNNRMSPELSSPAIVRTLKPASTPSKPVGGLKWSTAAAVGIPELHESDTNRTKSQAVASPSPTATNGTITNVRKETAVSQPTTSAASSQASDHSKFVKVLENSSLSRTELNLFSDLNLIKLPPGMQDLILSFTTKRNNPNDFKLLYNSNEYDKYTTPIRKPYLPLGMEVSIGSSNHSQIKPPLQLFKLQSYWNKVRANDEFDRVVTEIRALTAQDNAENAPIINELTLVLFYGFYYGITPVENLIAESCLFNLGWKPYNSHTDNSTTNQITSPTSNGLKSPDRSKADAYYCWVRRIKLLSNPEGSSTFEFGDYQVFDLTFWEIFVRFGFKLDYSLYELEPSSSIC
ncbi:Not1 N-terminal domain, CCR4-Not complex component-domain-containing protein [Scheffersomyces xylosifermentans]|uniref:Not1 N-terminal domain, CCR4-Not complex component-domain-containing protein n=1 Tax=Scheffersomyces xylosifermentans TaxID=1304137 RepID=UPI00315D0D44